MGPSRFESVYRSIRQGEVVPVYYLTGDADVLKDDLVTAIVEATLEPSTRAFNLDTRSAGEVDAPELQTLVDTLPVLAQRRVVVIRNLELWRKNAKTWDALRSYLAHPAESTVLVLAHGAGEPPEAGLARAALHVDLQTPEPAVLRRWVDQRAERAGVHLEPPALEHLVRAVGPDLAHLATELDKLAAAKGSDVRVSAEDVAQLVGVNRGETVEDWLEAVIARDLPRALGLTDAVLPQAGVTAVRMVIALGAELVGVRMARALADGGLSGGRLERAVFEQLRRARPAGGRNWELQARAWAAAAEHWNAAELDRALRAAYQTDLALKSTTVSDDRATLRTLLLSLNVREAAA
jgi:DNA polymerase-3 subunit delta